MIDRPTPRDVRRDNPSLETVTVNGVAFRYAHVGSVANPLALLVHGFPDSPGTWRHLSPSLVKAGFRVVMPWTRGLPPTSAPTDDRFDASALADDVIGLHAALGGDDRAVLIGHDWGAVAGQVAAARPGFPFRRAVLLAVPPVQAMRHISATHLPVVAGRMWYAGLLAVPGSQHLVQPFIGPLVRRLWGAWSPDYQPTAADIDGALRILSTRRGLAATTALYRALPQSLLFGDLARRPDRMVAPTLFLHGSDDGCIHPALARAARAHPSDNADVRILDGVGHFMHLEDPERVNRLILDHVAAR